MKTKINSVVTETTTFTHDARDSLLTKVDPTGYTLSYGYDAIGNRTNLVGQAPSLAIVLNQSYVYDNRNRVSSITGNGKTSSFGYDAASRRVAATWPNSSTATNTYNNANELLSLVHKQSGGSTIASFTYGYDLAGNRTNMTTLEGVNNYNYNSNNWLTAATYPDARKQQFAYDGVGNRGTLTDITGTTTNTTTYTYDAANRLTSDSGSTYTYDGAGRLTNQVVNSRSRSYSYSFRSQMLSLVNTNATTFTYDFDGDGNRIAQSKTGCLSSRYVYDGPNCVLELNASNQVVHAYVNGLGIDQRIERIAFVTGAQSTRLVYYTDALGSVVAMTDSGQQTARSYSYEAFGKIRSETGTLTIDRYTYTAREVLGDSLGLYYYRWRVMDPNIGRFTSEDSLRFVDGSDLYAYVGGNPIGKLDSFGLSFIDCGKALGELGKATARLAKRDVEALACGGLTDKEHAKSISQAETDMNNALRKVSQNCGGPAAGAALTAAAYELSQAEELLSQWWAEYGPLVQEYAGAL